MANIILYNDENDELCIITPVIQDYEEVRKHAHAVVPKGSMFWIYDSELLPNTPKELWYFNQSTHKVETKDHIIDPKLIDHEAKRRIQEKYDLQDQIIALYELDDKIINFILNIRKKAEELKKLKPIPKNYMEDAWWN